MLAGDRAAAVIAGGIRQPEQVLASPPVRELSHFAAALKAVVGNAGRVQLGDGLVQVDAGLAELPAAADEVGDHHALEQAKRDRLVPRGSGRRHADPRR
jgi:hypothetical protein